LGRRRRRIVKIVKRKLPTVFSCPSCGEEAIRVVMSRSKSHALIQCAACGLKQETDISPADQMVDVYCRFTDKFYGANQASGQKQPDVLPEQVSTDQLAQPTKDIQKGQGDKVESEPQEASSASGQAEESKSLEPKDEEAELDASEDSETEDTPL